MATPNKRPIESANDRIVYREFGTDSVSAATEQKSLPVLPRQQTLRIRVERKGRGGKTVSVIEGLQLPSASLAILLKQLKSHCGSGGTAKDGTIELQGDHRQKLALWLEQRGYVVKLSGK
ncbi:MAG: translation initiation factor [Cyanobacteria bacterium]|nr:translation initiation factor [Cyanobacteriota bacterium]MDW8202664.1 translation initiation factor [Cyanobacteriota bacterium SKYGB_h_bin112]